MPDAVMVTSSFLPGRGGIESFLAELCHLLRPRIAVLAPATRDGKPLPADLGYPTHGCGASMLLPRRPVLEAIVDAAQRHGTDRVIFGTPWPLALLGPQLTSRGLRYASLVFGAETLVPSRIPGVSTRLARALAGADLLLPISRFTECAVRSFLQRSGHGVPQMDLVRARIDIERFKPDIDTTSARRRLRIRPDERVVLCFGRLVKRKGVDRMIGAMPEIARRVPGVVLVVAGTGPEQARLRRLAHRNGPVCFAGRVPEEDAPALFALADVFALPVVDRWFGLEAEGLGVVLLEAQACGVPCVTGRSGGSPEAIVHGKSGFVVDAGHAEELIDRTAWLLSHPDEAAWMGKMGRSFVEDEYSSNRRPALLLEWLG